MKTFTKSLKITLLSLSLLGTYSCEGLFDMFNPKDESAFPAASENQQLPNITEEDVTVESIPSAVFTVSTEDANILNLNMTGIQSPNGDDFVILKGTGDDNQNVWLEIDNELIGFSVINGSEIATKAPSSTLAKADLVFLVDNSGSMGEEADKLAEQIIEWSYELAGVMDIQFGCVGYGEYCVSGAIDFTSVETVSEYLNYSSGTRRTAHFSQNLSQEAIDDADNFYSKDECGAMALDYATKHFSYRNGANRIYVNLTDEGNQPGSSNPQWSVEIFNEESELYSWSKNSGTIHTVWSGGAQYFEEGYNYWSDLYDEDPTLMSIYTGGTRMIDADPYYTNVNLSDLPVTGAILNSFELSFDYTEKLKSGSHELKITIDDAQTNIKLVNIIPIEIAQ